MTYVIVSHWGWMFGALAFGGLVGWTIWQLIRDHWADRAVWIALALIGVAVLLSFLKLVPGRAGDRLELALLAIFFYGLGGVFGWLMRDAAEAPALVQGEYPPVEPMPAEWVRPPYLSKPGEVPWSVVVAGPEAVAAWTAARTAPGADAGTTASSPGAPNVHDAGLTN